MNYTKLKQQPKQGGVPRINLNQAAAATSTRDSVTSPIITPANTSAITEQVRQLAQQLANQIVAEQQQTQIG